MIERKYFIDFVTNSDAECSSNIDSDEEGETETDCDSDDLDDENEGLADHMPHRLLTAPCKILGQPMRVQLMNLAMKKYFGNSQKERKKKLRNWKKDDIENCDIVPDFVVLPEELYHKIKNI